MKISGVVIPSEWYSVLALPIEKVVIGVDSPLVGAGIAHVSSIVLLNLSWILTLIADDAEPGATAVSMNLIVGLANLPQHIAPLREHVPLGLH